MRLIAFSALVLISFQFCTAQEGSIDSMPEDDEDSMILSAVVSLHFTVSVSCDSWYSLNVIQFSDLFIQSIASTINEACGGCGFNISNFVNVVPSCGANTSTFQAKIRNWYSADYPLSDILRDIERRFNSSSTAITVPTNNFVADSIDTALLSFFPTGVDIDIIEDIGSGGGSSDGSTTGEDPIPTDKEVDVTTADLGASPIVVVESAGQTTTPLLVTMVTMVMGTLHFGSAH